MGIPVRPFRNIESHVPPLNSTFYPLNATGPKANPLQSSSGIWGKQMSLLPSRWQGNRMRRRLRKKLAKIAKPDNVPHVIAEYQPPACLSHHQTRACGSIHFSLTAQKPDSSSVLLTETYLPFFRWSELSLHVLTQLRRHGSKPQIPPR